MLAPMARRAPAIDGYMADNGISGFLLMSVGAAIADAAAAIAPEARRTSSLPAPPTMAATARPHAFSRNAAMRRRSRFAQARGSLGDPAGGCALDRPTVKASPEALHGAELRSTDLWGRAPRPGRRRGSRNGRSDQRCRCSGLAVDFPTGASGVTGDILGTAVVADMTITFYCLAGSPAAAGALPLCHCRRRHRYPCSVMDTVRPLPSTTGPTSGDLPCRRGGALTRSALHVDDVRVLIRPTVAAGTPLSAPGGGGRGRNGNSCHRGPDRRLPDGRACTLAMACTRAYDRPARDALAGAIAACRAAGVDAFEAASASAWALAEARAPAAAVDLLTILESVPRTDPANRRGQR